MGDRGGQGSEPILLVGGRALLEIIIDKHAVHFHRPGGMRTRRIRRRLFGLLAMISLGTACHRSVAMLNVPGRSTVALTGGPNASMIYLARTTDGVLAIDLGWWGHRASLARALDSLHAVPADVRSVFLTHSHRDHVAAWPTVRQARFYVSGPEQPLLVEQSLHGGWIPRLAERIKPSRVPRAGEVAVLAFSQDTVMVVGADTVRAYLLPGHTRGSVAYLFRGVLFLGDAVTYSPLGGFAPARRGFSDDRRASVENLARLWARLPPDAVVHVCTAHARCAKFTPQFLEDVAR